MFNFKRIAVALSLGALFGLTSAPMVGLAIANHMTDTIVLHNSDFNVPTGDFRANIEAEDTYEGDIIVSTGTDFKGSIENEGTGDTLVTIGSTNHFMGTIDTVGDVTLTVEAGGVYMGNVEAGGNCDFTGDFDGNADCGTGP